MTYDDLPDHPAPGVLLYCRGGGAECSATVGDYFMCDGADEIACECGNPMQLVIKRTTFEPVNPDQGDHHEPKPTCP